MIKQATLKDVAKVCGVSSMTVSNVLNGRDKEVGAKTRERILYAIAELGYRQNLAAKRLRAHNIPEGMIWKRIRLAFLSPKVLGAIVDGKTNRDLTIKMLTQHDLPREWSEQETLFLS